MGVFDVVFRIQCVQFVDVDKVVGVGSGRVKLYQFCEIFLYLLEVLLSLRLAGLHL